MITRSRKRELRRTRNLGVPEAPTDRPGRLFYVTARDGRRTAALLGPFVSHMTALERVPRGRRLAEERFGDQAAFASFGTASLPRSRRPRVVFGR